MNSTIETRKFYFLEKFSGSKRENFFKSNIFNKVLLLNTCVYSIERTDKYIVIKLKYQTEFTLSPKESNISRLGQLPNNLNNILLWGYYDNNKGEVSF